MKPRKEHYRQRLPHFQQPGQWYSVTCSLAGAMPKGAMEKYRMALEAAKNRYLFEKERAGVSGVGLSKSNLFDFGKSKSRGVGVSNSNNFNLGKSKPPFGSQNFDLGKSKSRLVQAKKKYYIALRNYRLAYDKILNHSPLPGINLTLETNRKILEEALLFWEGKRLHSHAWCIMSNHFHWVLTVFEEEVGVGLSRELDFPKSNLFDFGKSKSPGVGVSNSNTFDLGKSKSRQNFKNFDLGKSKSRSSGKPVYLQDILHSVKLFTARKINNNENRNGQLWYHESFETTIRNDKHFLNAVNYTLNNPVKAGLVKQWQDWPGCRCFEELEF